LDNLITIKTFTYSSEVLALRGRLESEGIECFTQDELTAQVDPFYSNAIGGIKLRVKESDLARALEILKESGYEPDHERPVSSALSKFIQATSNLPFLKTLQPEIRLLVVIGIVTSLLITIIYFATLPSMAERLTKYDWCVDNITYKNMDYKPASKKYFRMVAAGACDERIDFNTSGRVTLPGFNSFEAQANWMLAKHSLQIMQADTFDFVYNGTYDINLSGDQLILKSSTTTMYCHAQILKSIF
jgi:hypothetical protein